MIKKSKQKRGFTLVETMVAISILVVALTAPLTLASQSLFAAVYAKDQITASYLAQEAIEMVREKRDNNLLKIIRGDAGVGWLDGLPLGTFFSVDVFQGTFVQCGTGCKTTPLNFDGAFYTYQSGTPTRFSRKVFINKLPSNNEATVTATVYWQTGTFKQQKTEITEQIFNWIPPTP